MSYNNYCEIMRCLDIIEAELDKIAAHVGHPTYAEFRQAENDSRR